MRKIEFILLFFSFFLYFFYPQELPAVLKRSGDVFFLNCRGDFNGVAEGLYMIKDDVLLEKGKRINNYYKNNFGIRFFSPIDKRYFPSPPSGWCSWYYYMANITPCDILENLNWLSKNLKGYGLKYIQIDCGWQCCKERSRNWFELKPDFKKYGMRKLCKTIEKKGFLPGIWISPFGTDVKYGNFKNYISLSPSSWLGKYLYLPVDEKYVYLKQIFSKIKRWGFKYVKLDGEPEAIKEYKKRKSLRKFRRMLSFIKKFMGNDVFLLGCWGTPIEGIGIFNGSRIGKDVRCGFNGFQIAFRSTLRWYFLHNIVWYSDPDVLMVRPPISYETAMAWATLLGMTGEVLMLSDKMVELSKKRVELIKKILPPQNIYPVNLYPINRDMPIWDLKIKNSILSYDVVAYFNFSEELKGKFLDFSKIGLSPERKYHIFDFWHEEYLGIVKKRFYIDAPPEGVGVFVISEVRDTPSLIATSRHIVQSVEDIKEIVKRENGFKMKLNLIKGERDSLFFSYDMGEWEVANIKFSGKYEIVDHGRWLEVILLATKNGINDFQIKFKKKRDLRKKIKLFSPIRFKVKKVEKDYLIKLETPYYPVAGYLIYLDGKIFGYTFSNEFRIPIKTGKNHTLSIKSFWYDGKLSNRSLKIFMGEK